MFRNPNCFSKCKFDPDFIEIPAAPAVAAADMQQGVLRDTLVTLLVLCVMSLLLTSVPPLTLKLPLCHVLCIVMQNRGTYFKISLDYKKESWFQLSVANRSHNSEPH